MANGLLTNSELLESIIGDLNEYLRNISVGQFVRANLLLTGIVQKVMNLKRTIDDDLKNREKTIAVLKEQLRAHGVEVVDFSPENIEEALNG